MLDEEDWEKDSGTRTKKKMMLKRELGGGVCWTVMAESNDG